MIQSMGQLTLIKKENERYALVINKLKSDSQSANCPQRRKRSL